VGLRPRKKRNFYVLKGNDHSKGDKTQRTLRAARTCGGKKKGKRNQSNPMGKGSPGKRVFLGQKGSAPGNKEGTRGQRVEKGEWGEKRGGLTVRGGEKKSFPGNGDSLGIGYLKWGKKKKNWGRGGICQTQDGKWERRGGRGISSRS